MEMVQVFTLTGVTAAATTPISIRDYVSGKVRGLVAAKMVSRRSWAVAAHSHVQAVHSHVQGAHSHAFAGVSLAAHMHSFANAVTSGVPFVQDTGLRVSLGVFVTSDPTGGWPPTGNRTGGTPAGAINAQTPAIAAQTPAIAGAGAIAIVHGLSEATYVIDSNGRIVNTATHPAAGHAVLKEAALGVMQVELGVALRSTDLLIVTGLMQHEAGGIF